MAHTNMKVLKDIFDKIFAVFGKMELNTGDIHEFLGMNIKIHRNEKRIEIEIEMKD